MKLLSSIFLGLLISFNSAFAQSVAITGSEARSWAETKGQELIRALAEPDLSTKYYKLDKMLSEDVNLDYIAKFVIGKYAKLMTKDQWNQYNSLFHRYALSLYKQFNLTFDASLIDFSIESVIENKNFSTVNCSVDTRKLFQNVRGIEPQLIPVKFKLIRGQKNRIQAVDVEIADVSLVIEYRKQFYRMIKERGEDINWFLQSFQEQVNANEIAIKNKQPL